MPTHVWHNSSKMLCLSSVPHDACIPVTLSAPLVYPCALWCSSGGCVSTLSWHLETNLIGKKTELLTGGPQIPWWYGLLCYSPTGVHMAVSLELHFKSRFKASPDFYRGQKERQDLSWALHMTCGTRKRKMSLSWATATISNPHWETSTYLQYHLVSCCTPGKDISSWIPTTCMRWGVLIPPSHIFFPCT